MHTHVMVFERQQEASSHVWWRSVTMRHSVYTSSACVVLSVSAELAHG